MHMSSFPVYLIRVLTSWLTVIAFIVIAVGEPAPGDGFYEPVSTQTFYAVDALLHAQGMTTDGEHFFYSSNYGLIKTELDSRTVLASNLCAIPRELLSLGCKHIGGITYYDGKIYCPIEDSKVFENLYIATYSADTLEYIESFKLSNELHENGVPWCVANPDEGVIYSARRDHITSLNVYDAQSLEFLREIQLTDSVHKVQGGEMYNGILFLSVSRGEQAVYAVDPASGKVQKAFDRNLPNDAEGEGMTILPTADGALFHIMEIAGIRVASRVRHYAFDISTLSWNNSKGVNNER